MENNQNGKQPKPEDEAMRKNKEKNQINSTILNNQKQGIGLQPKWKTTKKEDDQNGRRPK